MKPYTFSGKKLPLPFKGGEARKVGNHERKANEKEDLEGMEMDCQYNAEQAHWLKPRLLRAGNGKACLTTGRDTVLNEGPAI